MIEWISENKEIVISVLSALLSAGVIDLILGKIPDRYFKYIGAARRFMEWVERRKVGK